MNSEPALHLPNRDAIELAWLSVYTTGDAPTVTPVLDAMIDMLPPKASLNREQGASLYLSGGVAGIMKGELVRSLGIMAAYLPDKPDTAQAAAALRGSLES